MSNVKDWNSLLAVCGGVKEEIKEIKSQWHSGTGKTRKEFYKFDEIVVPDDVYLEVISTSIKGTIGRLLEIDVQTYKQKRRRFNIENNKNLYT